MGKEMVGYMRRMRKWIVSMAAGGVLLMGAGLVTAQTTGFSDTASHWARQQIERLAGKGLVAGYEDGTFRPDRTMTRAEVVTVFDRFDRKNDAERAQMKAEHQSSITAQADQSAALSNDVDELAVNLEAVRNDLVAMSPGLVDGPFRVQLEAVGHSYTDDELRLDLTAFVRNVGAAEAEFDLGKIVLEVASSAGGSDPVVVRAAETERVALAPGDGRVVKMAYVLHADQLVGGEAQGTRNISIKIDGGDGDSDRIGVQIDVNCTWSPLKCTVKYKFDF